MPTFKSLLAVALVVSAVVLGSGRVAAEEELVAVSGRVILNGKPLPEARIIFHLGDGQFVGGKTDDEGKYKVTRVPAGTHKVTVEMLPGSKVRLPDRYSSEEQSELSVQVKKGANEIDLDLRSK
ncbi:MAG TPA: carboxypeptidase-like regulatory domain-containing protein [Gemmataceae bacterium]|nr:carboxypeptidase-like regulatory domain-containing protein [Gemmataceae bacterium]